MRAVVLNGLRERDVGQAISDEVRSCLEHAGWITEEFILRDHKVAPCVEDFGCWIRKPGQCLIKDDAQEITRAFLTCDLVVFLTPVTFGGYSSELKKVLDRSICFALPYFEETGGETHHPTRYDRMPAMFYVGTETTPDDNAESVFRELVRRNALNMRPPAYRVSFVSADTDAARVAEEVLALANEEYGS
ncbi:MAG TPA: NAD(P)H-dependent oxidoreductase [Candidatus Latescibacteria bacterium]|nr:MAG: NADPH-dependent FMN reductase [Candidatus Latescibacteria bacterium ADurb.Bin168]HPU84603.1 NAD(P)H-dependent oxidoreductase [Candidatus Latescibacterota bacterium]